MAKSQNAILADARRKREAAALKAAGGNRYLASYRHHESRLARAIEQKDYSTMRDAQKAMADLRPYLGGKV
jgi:hypothetical protein